VGKSLQIRERKALARKRDIRLQARGKLQRTEVCLAAALDLRKAPLILSRGQRPREDDEDEAPRGCRRPWWLSSYEPGRTLHPTRLRCDQGQLRAWKRHKMMRMLLALSFELCEKSCSVSPTKKSPFRTRELALSPGGKPEVHPTVIALAPSERTSSVRYSQ